MAHAEYIRMSIQMTGMDPKVSDTLTAWIQQQGVRQTINGYQVPDLKFS